MPSDYVYSDFHKDLKIDDNGNVTVLYDEDVIVQSIKSLMATVTGERVRSNIGGSLIRLLFEPIDEYIEDEIQSALTEIIERYEPRVDIVRIIANADPDANTIDVQVNLRLKKTRRPVTFNTRLRSLSGSF